MTAPTRLEKAADDPAAVRAAGRVVSIFGVQPLAGLTKEQLEALEWSIDVLLVAVATELTKQTEYLKAPRARGGLRLAAAHGELTAAGERSLRARKAAKAKRAK